MDIKRKWSGWWASVDNAEQSTQPPPVTDLAFGLQSPEVIQEVEWRIEILRELSHRPELAKETAGLFDRITAIFTAGLSEQEILERLRALSSISTPSGKTVDVRRFHKGQSQVLNDEKYCLVMTKKMANTREQIANLIEMYPERRPMLSQLDNALNKIMTTALNGNMSATMLQEKANTLRSHKAFEIYEDLKNRALTEWLRKFSPVPEEKLLGMPPTKIAELVQTYKRHQLTKLLKLSIREVDIDMSEHLSVHDTLESTFSNKDFWGKHHELIEKSFVEWIDAVLNNFGLLKQRRYSIFEWHDKDNNNKKFLLFGLGIKNFDRHPSSSNMVYYIKPFLREGRHLIEVRNRDLINPSDYFAQLRHYVLPFIYAFDHIEGFDINEALTTFFVPN